MDSTQARIETQSSPDGARLAVLGRWRALQDSLSAVVSGAKGKDAALDRFANIPEFKYCAVKVQLGGQAPVQGSYGGGQMLERLSA